MTSVNRQNKWFVDPATEQIFRVVWMYDETVLLESDEFVRIPTTTLTLEKHLKPLETPYGNPFSSWVRDQVKG